MFSLRGGASLGALAIAIVTSPAMAQGTQPAPAPAPAKQNDKAPKITGGVHAIIVTATRRVQNMQDVPVSVQAIGTQGLARLNITNFSDYMQQLPNVTAGGSGPGQNTIYIRGLASTTPNLTTAGVAGLAPNVSFYLDEQPIAEPGRNLDVYAADLKRIEVLSGPQGTLFGASSQAGVVRLITNKPDPSHFAANASGGVAYTKSGDPSYKTQLMLNVPVTDNFALRGVVYLDHKGGYIDNVHGTVSLRSSGRFRPQGTVRYNGVPVSSVRAGFQSDPASLNYINNNVTFIKADNSALVQKNFNDSQYAGFRLSALWEFSPNWKLTIEETGQTTTADGVFFEDPRLGDLKVQQYTPNKLKDQFSNTSWTLEGRAASLDLLYTGAYTDRTTDQTVDYTDYLYVGQYLPYYMCDTAVSYPGYVSQAPANPTCYAPKLSVKSHTRTTVLTQEFRVNTPEKKRIRATAGVFFSDLILKERNDFYYASEQVRGSDGVTRGFSPIYPFTNTAVTGTTGNAYPGYYSDPGPFPPGVAFRNDVRRSDQQFGVYGQVSFDVIPNLLTLTGGMRYYNVRVGLSGAATSSFCKLKSPIFGANAGVPYSQQTNIPGCGGTNLSLKYGPNNPNGNPTRARDRGTIFKGTITLRPKDGVMLYATYSEGFRPGLLNRPGGATRGNYTVPYELKSDKVKNYEIGWKTELLGHQLRFNADAFYVDVSRLQTTIFDPSIVNLFFSDNAANAWIKGVEGQFTYAPYKLPGLTVTGAFSFLDTKITKVLLPTNDVTVGSHLAYAPPFQGNLRIRYTWAVSKDMDMYVMPEVTHSASKYTDVININKLHLKGYTTFNLSVGLEKDHWTFVVYGNNLTDQRAELSGSFVYDVPQVTVSRPLTVGARVSFKY